MAEHENKHENKIRFGFEDALEPKENIFFMCKLKW